MSNETSDFSRDPARTRARIMAAAVARFADKGLSGARVDSIAEAAGVNKRMLYHYFGNKEALFGAVIEHVYGQICQTARDLALDDASPEDAVRRIVRFIWAYYRDNPEAITLLNSENLHKARHIQNSAAIRDMEAPFVQRISEVLKRGRTTGAFTSDMDPVDLYVTVLGLVYFYRSNRFTLSEFFGRDMAGETAQERWRDHVETVVLAALRG